MNYKQKAKEWLDYRPMISLDLVDRINRFASWLDNQNSQCRNMEIQDTGICKNCGTNHTITTTDPSPKLPDKLDIDSEISEVIKRGGSWRYEQQFLANKINQLIDYLKSK